jgi:pyruvate kinase
MRLQLAARNTQNQITRGETLTRTGLTKEGKRPTSFDSCFALRVHDVNIGKTVLVNDAKKAVEVEHLTKKALQVSGDGIR